MVFVARPGIPLLGNPSKREVTPVHDQQPAQTLGADDADETLRDRIRPIAFAFGARTGVRMISIPSLAKTSSKLADPGRNQHKRPARKQSLVPVRITRFAAGSD
jgi:hypothetical protein